MYIASTELLILEFTKEEYFQHFKLLEENIFY